MRAQTPLDFAIGVSLFLIVVTFVLAFVPGMLQPFEGNTQEETAASDRIADGLSTGTLAEDRASPHVLDRGCLIGFFALEHTDGDPDNDVDAYPSNDDSVRDDLHDVTSASWWDGSCNFDASLGIFDRIGFADSGLDVRIRLVADLNDDGTSGTLCVDANSAGGNVVPDPDDRIIETDDPYNSGSQCDMTQADYDVAFETANEPPADIGSVVVARRVVHVEGGLDDGTSDASLIVEVW